MFVLELTFTAPLDRVQAVLEEHYGWLEAHYAAGVFIASGIKEPPDGGIILAVGDDRARIEELTTSDPFVLAGVCKYAITEFIATKTSTELEGHRQEAPY